MSRIDIEKTLFLNEFDLVCEKRGKYSTKDIADYYEDKILYFKDDELAYKFATRLPDCDVKKIGKIIIDNKDVINNYDYARHVEGADVKAHGKVVIDSKDLKYNYWFALLIKGADVKAHEKVIIDSKDVEYNYLCAIHIKDCDMKAHEKIVLESKNPEYNYYFLRNVQGADIKAHEKVIIDSRNPEYNYLLSEYLNLDEDSISKISDVILESKCMKYIYKFYMAHKEVLKHIGKHEELENELLRSSYSDEIMTEIKKTLQLIK